MLKRMMVVAAASVALVACGGGAQVRVYKGTLTTAQTSGGQTITTTSTNSPITVMPGDMVGEWLFLNQGNIYSGNTSGEALTFMGNQGYTTTETGNMTMQSLTLSSGTGSMSTTALSLNLTGTFSVTQGTQTQNGTYTLTFTGARE